MDDWTTCDSCEAEFKIITDAVTTPIAWCPYCGEELTIELEDEDYDLDDWKPGDRIEF